mmetsp:Transcript_53698/g.139869  ORF Transcript_53698/g.139869 Transcript_53698/m.139869 type:complete len:248 (+) Transcript_53698:696-1439(+)
MVARTEKNLRPTNVTPSWLSGRSISSRGTAFSRALDITSADSVPVNTSAWPPMRCGSAGPAAAASASRSSVTPSGRLSPGRQSTPTGVFSSNFTFSAASPETSPSTTTQSTLLKSFWMSPSARSLRLNRSQSASFVSPARSSARMDVNTEPSSLRGTSTGNSHLRREKTPSRRAFCSSKGSLTPLPSAVSATERSDTQGFASYSGSSVSETRIVSPRPSIRSVPMPAADLMRPSEPPPASVTPRCRG